MKSDWFLITLPTLIAVAILALSAPLRDAAAQERRPCVNQGAPEGCVPFTRSPQPRQAVAPDVDKPSIATVNEWPAAKAKEMPEDWQKAPDYLPKEGTVTVSPVTPEDAPPQ